MMNTAEEKMRYLHDNMVSIDQSDLNRVVEKVNIELMRQEGWNYPFPLLVDVTRPWTTSKFWGSVTLHNTGSQEILDHIRDKLEELGIDPDDYWCYHHYHDVFEYRYFMMKGEKRGSIGANGKRLAVDLLLYLRNGVVRADLSEAEEICEAARAGKTNLYDLGSGLTVRFYENGNFVLSQWTEEMQARYLTFMDIRRKLRS